MAATSLHPTTLKGKKISLPKPAPLPQLELQFLPTPPASTYGSNESGTSIDVALSPPPESVSMNERRSRSASSPAAPKKEVSGGSGKGLGGFFRKFKGGGSRGASESDPPPLPTGVPMLELNFGSDNRVLGNGKAGTYGERNHTPVSRTGSNLFPPSGKREIPAEEEDFASLLLLFSNAADAGEITDGEAPHSPTVRRTPDSPSASPVAPTKPYLSFLSHLATDSNYHTPTSFKPPLTPPESPRYGNTRFGTTQTTPPPGPKLRPLASQATRDDEDDYGSDSELWTSPSTPVYKRAATSKNLSPSPVALHPYRRGLPVLHAKQPPSTPYTPSPSRSKFLGRGAQQILELSKARLGPLDAEAAEKLSRPLSTNKRKEWVLHSNESGIENKRDVRVALHRLRIVRRLAAGVTMLEAVELERTTKKQPVRARFTSMDSTSSKDSDEGVSVSGQDLTASVSNALKILSGTKDDILTSRPTTSISKVVLSTSLSSQSRKPTPLRLSSSLVSEHPTPSSIRKWLQRPSFAESHLVHILVEGGGELIDLVRPRPGAERREASARLRIFSKSDLAELAVVRGSREVISTSGRPQREYQHRSKEPTKTSPTQQWVTTADNFSRPGPKIILPGPLLLQSLTQDPDSFLSDEPPSAHFDDEDEDGTPLAFLRTSSIAAAVAAKSKADMEAELREANEKAADLRAELVRVRNNEWIRKERQEKLDREREELARETEMQRQEDERMKEVQRRLADQKRRSRAAGQGGEAGGRNFESTPVPNQRRAASLHSHQMPRSHSHRSSFLPPSHSPQPYEYAPVPQPQYYTPPPPQVLMSPPQGLYYPPPPPPPAPTSLYAHARYSASVPNINQLYQSQHYLPQTPPPMPHHPSAPMMPYMHPSYSSTSLQVPNPHASTSRRSSYDVRSSAVPPRRESSSASLHNQYSPHQQMMPPPPPMPSTSSARGLPRSTSSTSLSVPTGPYSPSRRSSRGPPSESPSGAANRRLSVDMRADERSLRSPNLEQMRWPSGGNGSGREGVGGGAKVKISDTFLRVEERRNSTLPSTRNGDGNRRPEVAGRRASFLTFDQDGY